MPDANNEEYEKQRQQELSQDTEAFPPIDSHDRDVRANKHMRRALDNMLQDLKTFPSSRERSIAIRKLQESIMWLGMDLKRLGGPNPYPNSKDPSNTKIDPTADNLKL